MNTTETNQNQKNKKRLLPLMLLLGLGLTGGLIFTGSLLSKRNKQVSDLEQQLLMNTSKLTTEKDSLKIRLENAADDYAMLQSENSALSDKMNDQKALSNQISYKYKNLVEREQECQDNYKTLLSSFDQLQNENLLIKKDLAQQQTTLEKIQQQLLNSDSVLATQNNLINYQKDKIRTDSSYSLTRMDSIIKENSSRFINITELNGAIGINIRNVPYADYFYGITNVSGLFVNKHFISGVGFGLLAFGNDLTAPLYLDFRYHFNKRSFTPYIYADGGLVLKFDYLKEPMLFINPGVGLYKSISNKFALNLGAGVFIQRDLDAKASFVNFKLGIIYIKGN